MARQNANRRSVGCGRSSLEILLLVLVAVSDCSYGCMPGRGRYSRGKLHRLQPLVYKQKFPNVYETAMTASGPETPAVTAKHPDFQHLVPNYNPDIVYRDDEGTGEDRVMTQRASDRLNILSVAVMNYWPGVRLRVLEAWSEDRYDPSETLHLSGRAVHIATSDHDPKKLGTLARLAVQSGFDFVYYRSHKWIHCSVREDYNGANMNSEGCFSADSVLLSDSGNLLNISQLPNNNSLVAAIDQSGKLIMTPVITWLDFNPAKEVKFVILTTESGRRLTVTPNHLLYVLPSSCADIGKYGNMSSHQVEFHSPTLITKAIAMQAANVNVGSYLLASNQKYLFPDRVVSLTQKYGRGVYAPLTWTGTLLVNDLLVSCYAQVQSHQTAHTAIAPLRWMWQLQQWFCHVLECSSERVLPPHGVHWYARLLLRLTKHFLPSHQVIIEN